MGSVKHSPTKGKNLAMVRLSSSEHTTLLSSKIKVEQELSLLLESKMRSVFSLSKMLVDRKETVYRLWMRMEKRKKRGSEREKNGRIHAPPPTKRIPLITEVSLTSNLLVTVTQGDRTPYCVEGPGGEYTGVPWLYCEIKVVHSLGAPAQNRSLCQPIREMWQETSVIMMTMSPFCFGLVGEVMFITSSIERVGLGGFVNWFMARLEKLGLICSFFMSGSVVWRDKLKKTFVLVGGFVVMVTSCALVGNVWEMFVRHNQDNVEGRSL